MESLKILEKNKVVYCQKVLYKSELLNIGWFVTLWSVLKFCEGFSRKWLFWLNFWEMNVGRRNIGLKARGVNFVKIGFAWKNDSYIPLQCIGSNVQMLGGKILGGSKRFCSGGVASTDQPPLLTGRILQVSRRILGEVEPFSVDQPALLTKWCVRGVWKSPNILSMCVLSWFSQVDAKSHWLHLSCHWWINLYYNWLTASSK